MTGRSGRSRSEILAEFLSYPATLIRVWRHRRTVGRLTGLDDRLLADIGLTRGEVQAVLAEPLLRDPSEVLARSVRSKRAARAATAREALVWAREDIADAPRRAA